MRDTVKTADSVLELEVLGAPFNNIDADGEFFTSRTKFLIDSDAVLPVLENHGMHQPSPEILGRAKILRRDKRGLWFKIKLEAGSKRARELYQRAKDGLLRVSSGAVNYLVKRARSGELIQWAIGEISLVSLADGQRPSNPRAVAAPYMAKIYAKSELDIPTTWETTQEELAKKRDQISKTPPKSQEVLKNLHKLAKDNPDIVWENDPFDGGES